jgi:hypothetical protein
MGKETKLLHYFNQLEQKLNHAKHTFSGRYVSMTFTGLYQVETLTLLQQGAPGDLILELETLTNKALKSLYLHKDTLSKKRTSAIKKLGLEDEITQVREEASSKLEQYALNKSKVMISALDTSQLLRIETNLDLIKVSLTLLKESSSNQKIIQSFADAWFNLYQKIYHKQQSFYQAFLTPEMDLSFDIESFVDIRSHLGI